MTGRVLLPEGKLYTLRAEYAECAALEGAAPEVVRWNDRYPDALDFDALLLCGGVDIAPERFGKALLANGSEEIDPDRDAFEFSLLDDFLCLGKPVYGICRGMQLINVALGGDLWQDLPSQCGLRHSAGDGEDTLWHEITWNSGRTERVNSLHHQAVRRLGDGLVCLARAPDGIVEAICHETMPVCAVQWHPERMEGAFRVLTRLINDT